MEAFLQIRKRRVRWVWKAHAENVMSSPLEKLTAVCRVCLLKPCSWTKTSLQVSQEKYQSHRPFWPNTKRTTQLGLVSAF